VTDYTQRRFIDESARRRDSPCAIDLMTINDSNRRNRRSANGLQFDALRDERTGDENRPLFNLLLVSGGFLDRRIGERCSSKNADRHQSCSAE